MANSTPNANFDVKQLDVFKEIGNIGAGNAATALASILNKRIDMSIPEAYVVPFNSIVNILRGPETVVTGILVDISGDLDGYILLILELDCAQEMVRSAMGDDTVKIFSEPQISLGDDERDTLIEISNILVGAFLSAVSTIANLTITPSVPQIATDMLGAIISVATVEYGKMGDSVLFLKTQFTDETNDMAGHFFLIPDYKSYKILIDSLGL